MKLLMFHAPEFWYKPHERCLDTLEAPSDPGGERTVADAVVVFYQCEAEDHKQRGKVLTKLVKNVKWMAGKAGTKRVVLHSFGHLSSSKAEPGFAKGMVDDAVSRLEGADYEVVETPFGWLFEWKLHVVGESLGRVFKEF
jgi:hypothetical protein